MKFCKRCHKRVIKEPSVAKDLVNICLCFDYLRVGGSDVERFLEGLVTERNRNVKKRILPVRLPHMES